VFRFTAGKVGGHHRIPVICRRSAGDFAALRVRRGLIGRRDMVILDHETGKRVTISRFPLPASRFPLPASRLALPTARWQRAAVAAVRVGRPV
jgi:hypothetical protein